MFKKDSLISPAVIPFPSSSTITLLLTVSMVISRLASYLVSTAILLMSAYMQSVLLFPNVSMFARSVEVVTNGQIAWVEVIIIAWISSICMLVGYLYLKNSDIINKHR